MSFWLAILGCGDEFAIATTFVSDIPGEVELLPSLWGRIEFSQAP